MKVVEVMHHGVAWAGPDAPIAALAKRMSDADVGCLPIVDDGKLVGIVTDRDLVLRTFALDRDPGLLTAHDVMTRDVVHSRFDDDAEDAVRKMESKAIRRLPVLDAENRLVGMVSLGDISHIMTGDVSAEVLRAVSAHHE